MARAFNGSTDYIDTSTGPSISSGGAFTFACWALLASGAGNFPVLIDDGGTGTSLLFGVNIGSGGNAGFNLFVNGSQSTNTASPATNTWFNVVGTFDGSSAKIFVNGAQQGGSSGSGASGFTKLFIGNGSEGGNSFWDGNICEVGVWNIALGQTDITTLALKNQASIVQPQALIGYWPLAGINSPEPDLSTGGNSGVLHGTSFVNNPPGVPIVLGQTTLTNRAGRYFSRKDYAKWLDKITKENEESDLEYNKLVADAVAERNLSDIERADRDYSNADEEYGQSKTALFGNLTATNHIRFSEAKERREKARKERDHHYFMDVVKKAWADHEAKKAK